MSQITRFQHLELPCSCCCWNS